MVLVNELKSHEAKNYALTHLVVVSARELTSSFGKDIRLNSKIIEATPNHPMLTESGNRKMGEIKIGEKVMCLDSQTGNYESFTVLQKYDYAGGVQKVYNIEANGGSTFMMNDVMVMQK